MMFYQFPKVPDLLTRRYKKTDRSKSVDLGASASFPFRLLAVPGLCARPDAPVELPLHEGASLRCESDVTDGGLRERDAAQ